MNVNPSVRGLGWYRQLVLGLSALALTAVAFAGDSTWTSRGPEGVVVLSLVIDPSAPGTLYAGTDGGVFKSGNGGRTWVATNTGLIRTFVSVLAIDPSAPATLYAGTPEGVFKSTDGGGNWRAMNRGLTSLSVDTLAIDPRTPSTLYAGAFVYFCEEVDSCFFKSTDGGSSWSAVHISSPNPYPRALAIDPVTPTTIYVGTYQGVFKSIDGGGSWSVLSSDLTNRNVAALLIDPSAPGTLYAGTAVVGSEGGIFKSTDGGGRWSALHVGLSDTWVDALAVDPLTPGTVYAGTIGSGVFKSSDGGVNWTELNAGLTQMFVSSLAIDPSAQGRLYAGTAGGVYDYGDGDVVGQCVRDSTTLCVRDSRFQVRTQWTTRDGSNGFGQAVALTGDAGYFTFFDPANIEVVVKALNGCGLNGNFWIFAGGLTNVSVVMTVTDSRTGDVKTYVSPLGMPFQPIQDTRAFATCGVDTPETAPVPAGDTEASLVPPIVSESFASAAPCLANATTLCLNNSRVQARARWSARDGRSGEGQVIPLTEDTGAFWFFNSQNVEMVVKVLDGCSVNSRYWAFAGGLTNVDVALTLTDTQTGDVKTYTNSLGTPFPPIQDTNAFATCP
jgi:photosystem II stability/assembly factor-like uncharacterized protein